MRRIAVLAALVALAACASAREGDPLDAETKIDAGPRPDAGPEPDAFVIPDAAPGTPDATPIPDAAPVGPPDTCATANALTAGATMPGGTTVTGDNTGYANDTQPSSSCTGYTPDGPDAVYRVTVAAGDVITAIVTPTAWDASIFISSTCEFAAACILGADGSAGDGAESVAVTASTAGTYFVVVESWDPGAFGPYSLRVTVQ
jgi:hypothetical protein